MQAPDQPLIYCNPAFSEITGYSQAAVLGRNWGFLQGQGTSPKAIETMRQYLRLGIPGKVILKNYRQDGTEFWHELSLLPVRNLRGDLTHFIGIHGDITEQRQKTMELQRCDRLLAGVAAATTCLLTSTNSLSLVLKSALKALGESTAVDRVYLFEYHTDPSTGNTLMMLNERWSQKDATPRLASQSSSQNSSPNSSQNSSPSPTQKNAIPGDKSSTPANKKYFSSPQFPLTMTAMGSWWQAAMTEGKPVGGKVADLPEPARSIFREQDICSILIVPVQIQGKCWGFLGFDHHQTEWEYSATEKSILLAAAGTLGGAIARHQAETQLASLNVQLETLVKQRTLDLEIANQHLRQEITTRCHIESQLRHNAYHDSLTGLPNRMLLMEKLYEALHQLQHTPDYLFALLFLDLDRFKVINDSLGHAIGDSLLVAIGAILSRCIRQGKDVVARLGGDEFAILLDNLNHPDESIQVAERIIQEITKPFLLQGQEIFTGVSIGIAYSHQNYHQPEEMLRDADLVMYRAKSSGRSRYEIFDQTIHQQTVATLKLENDLRRAVKTLYSHPQFHLQYQPIVSLNNHQQVLGFEALVRWQHPDKGMISPLTFVPLAEETGLIVSLGEWILNTACQQAALWQREFKSKIIINVNLSPRQFTRPDLVERIEKILADTGLSSENLKLEITESILLDGSSQITETLKRLKEMNIKMCIDDFGTGYSSLSYLHHFPVDTLKIDRSFIQQMTLESRHNKIIQTIINLAHNLDMQVVAEGVESQAQLQQLQALDCEGGQGYLFSQPLNGNQVVNFLKVSKVNFGKIE
ncbi:MAG: EAL domain-containing protein [Coleofasciculaceae cyanobacterium SM2_1_6]|nr:EAL domain-containing protein [Coleofasciculaceae cyanobacterium SM2_1_6]